MKLPAQRDLLLYSDKALAQAYRIAAETARRDPFFTPEDGEARARYYLEQAVRLEPQS